MPRSGIRNNNNKTTLHKLQFSLPEKKRKQMSTSIHKIMKKVPVNCSRRSLAQVFPDPGKLARAISERLRYSPDIKDLALCVQLTPWNAFVSNNWSNIFGPISTSSLCLLQWQTLQNAIKLSSVIFCFMKNLHLPSGFWFNECVPRFDDAELWKYTISGENINGKYSLEKRTRETHMVEIITTRTTNRNVSFLLRTFCMISDFCIPTWVTFGWSNSRYLQRMGNFPVQKHKDGFFLSAIILLRDRVCMAWNSF